MPESLLVAVCAAGKHGITIRDLFSERLEIDPDICQWLWKQLLQTSGLDFVNGDESLRNSLDTQLENVIEDGQIRIVALQKQREIYLGIHQRSFFLSSVQITLLEAIGSGMAAGCSRTEIDQFCQGDTIPHKEFFRHTKSLLSRNLIVRINEFKNTPRIGKYAPPTAQPRWFLRRFIQLPLPVRGWAMDSAPAAIQQQCNDRRNQIDTTVIPVLIQYLTQRSPRPVTESELTSFAERQSILNGLDWIVVRERLFATLRVAWDYIETTPNQFDHCFRIVDAGAPADIPIDDALISSESGRTLPLSILMTPLSAQVYRIIDAAGSSGILSLTVFRQLRMLQRRGHRILKELSMLPGDDAIVQVADRHKTSLMYRLYRKAHMIQNSSTGTIKVESRSSRRQSRSDDIEDDGEESEEEDDDGGRIVDSFFMRRLRWVRDVVSARKAISLKLICNIIRHRESASVAQCAMKSVARLCNQLEADGDIVQRHIQPGDDSDYSVAVTVAVDLEFLSSFPDEAEAKIDDAFRLDRCSEIQSSSQDRSRSNNSNPSGDTYLIAYPVLCGFIRARMVRAKLFHLHLSSLALESRPYVRHWYLYDVFLSMPLTLFLLTAGAFDSLQRDVIFNERLVSLPIRQQDFVVQNSVMSALLDGVQFPSLRIQDILEVLQRLGLIRLWMPSSHPATWQITFHSESFPLFPDTEFDSLDSIHTFWIDLRIHCKAVFISEHRDKVALTGVDDPGPVDPAVLDRLPPNSFPELYVEQNWCSGHEIPKSKQEALELLDREQPIETEAELNDACENFSISTGKAAWFIARLHLRFAREFSNTIDMLDFWRADPILRRSRPETPLDSQKKRRRKSLSEDVKESDVTPSRRVRSNDMRTKLYLRGQSPEPGDPPVIDQSVTPLPTLSPVADQVTPRPSTRRRSSKKSDSVPIPPVPVEPECNLILPGSWTKELAETVVRVLAVGSRHQTDDVVLLSKEPRLNLVLTTIKLILLQPDDMYNANDGKAALKNFSDDEVEWAFNILSRSHLVVLRKNTPGSKVTRGHFTISAKAREHLRSPMYPYALRDSLQSQFYLRTLATACKPDSVATCISLASTGICQINSDDRSVYLELDDYLLSAVIEAYDSCIGGNQLESEAFQQPSPELSIQMTDFILEGGPEGVPEELLRSVFPGQAASDCLQWLISCDLVVAIDCFCKLRFVHQNYGDIYVIGDAVRRSWVLLDGSLNEGLIRNLQWMVISYLCDRPGTDHDVLASMIPVLSPLEFDILINCMMLDGTIWCRKILISEPSLICDHSSQSRIQTVFFSSPDSLIRCC